ncbi:MAG: PBP1A family penicillin-binding protein [Chloroflexi bacterium]|nr:PBP1A family penicillin-binding protein [Chloroflexota bacterium]
MLLMLVIALAGAAVLGGIGAVAAYAYVSRDLPSPERITERIQFQSSKIYDRNGVLLYEVYDPNKGRRTSVPIQEIPEHVKNAFLAAEDARFYHNPGIDVQGIARAFRDNVASRGERLSGGSTITQQLVKNTLLSDEKTLSRKVREAVLAIDISRRYSKDRILELYLNSVYFGNQAYGVQAAAEAYFGKSVQELDVAEAALLAGLIRSPSTTNPFENEPAAKAEQQRVLDLMARQGFLSPNEAKAAAAKPLQYNDKQYAELKAPHFVLWIRNQFENNPKYGQRSLFERGLEVTTTLDIRLQEAAEQILRRHVAGLARFNAGNGALVALNPATGEILAMVGSADYADKAIQGEVNVALAPRQPGSSIKPITYLAALQQGWTPATIIDDVETTFPGNPPYRPRNYDGRFHGPVTVRTALANSYNIPAVKALQFAGVPAMMDLAKRLGITTLTDPRRYGLALTLGGGEVRLLELTSAYGVLANGGRRVEPVSILKVSDTRGNVLDEWPGPQPQPVADARHAYLLTSILSDNAARTPAFGATSPLRLSRPAAVKTGTTDDFRDNWTVGYTSQLVVGVWVGNADNSPMRGTTGLTGAAPIWHDFMEFALQPLPVDPLRPPPGLQRAAIARDSGKLWTEGCPEEKIEDLFVAADLAKLEKCERPTPTPTPTPASVTPTETPVRPAFTPSPSVEELRVRVASTATAIVAAAATNAAGRRAPAATSTPATQSAPQQPQQPQQQSGSRSPTPTVAEAGAQATATPRPTTPTQATLAPGQEARSAPAPRQEGRGKKK